MMKKLLISNLFFFLSFTIFSQNVIFKTINDFSQFVEIDSNVNVILLGENHKGKHRRDILCEYFNILTDNNIDTIFIEQRYSAYVTSLIYNKNMHYSNCDCLTKAKKVIIPIDIEFNLAESLEAIEYILNENDLEGTYFYNENINIYSQYRKTGTFNQKFVLHFINKLQSDMNPFIKKFNLEFNTLLNNIYESFSTISPHEFNDFLYFHKRDSLMSINIENYVEEHKLKRWGGVFGSYHISLKEDRMFDKSVILDSNLIQFLMRKGLVETKNATRIIYDAYKRMINPKRLIRDDFIVSFYPEIKQIPKNKILIKLNNNTWWVFSKK